VVGEIRCLAAGKSEGDVTGLNNVAVAEEETQELTRRKMIPHDARK